MQAIEIGKGVHVGLTDLVNGVSRLDTPELKKVLDQLNQVLNRRNKPLPTDIEAQLLQKIREVIPASVVRRYKQLHTKMQQNTISEKEHEEMLLLTNFMEEKSTERVHLMGELAEIQQITLPELAENLRLRNFYG